LTNLLKAMLSFNLYCLSALHITWISTFWWVHATLFPTTCWAMNMCELTLAVSHPHRRRIGGLRGATQRGVRFLVDLCQGWSLVRAIFIFYFCKTSDMYKYSDYIMTFISIHFVILYVVFFEACMRDAPGFVP
jgi:hypothetical protein